MNRRPRLPQFKRVRRFATWFRIVVALGLLESGAPEPRPVGPLFAVQLGVKKRDQAAEDGNRVRNASIYLWRIAKGHIDREGQHNHEEGVDGCGVHGVPLKHHLVTIARDASRINCPRKGRDH